MRKGCLPFGAYYAPIQESAARGRIWSTVGTTVTIWHDRPDGHAHLSALRAREERNDADQRLRARLRVHGVRHGTPTEAWRLLHLLLLWVEPMPASSALGRLAA